MDVTKHLKPLGDRLIIKRIEEAYEGTIVIPDTVDQTGHFAEVVAVAEKVEEIKVGDTVILGEYAGSNMDIEGEKFESVYEEDVLAVIPA